MSTMTETNDVDFSAKLADIGLGCRLKIKRWGVSRVVDGSAKQTIADAVNAEPDEMTVAKKLIDTKDPAYRKVTSILSRTTKHWTESTLPWHDPGVRLCFVDHAEDMTNRVVSFRAELDGAVAVLNDKLPRLIEDRRNSLGDVFNQSDYPTTLDGAFNITVEWPNLSANPVLNNVNAKLYNEQAEIVRAQFSSAVTMAEQAFVAEMQEMLTTLCSRMDGLNDDTTKRFDEKTTGKLTRFFDRFEKMDLGSSDGLTKLVADAKLVVNGIQPGFAGATTDVRGAVRKTLGELGTKLDGMLIESSRGFRFDD